MSFKSLVFTPAVKALQERYGSRVQYERMEARMGASENAFGELEADFLALRDSFYIATVGAGGWPYVQHRGGPKGFLKVIDGQTLAFADLRGNKQYITTGNLATDDRVALILVDYPHQARLKILGRVEVFEGEKAKEWIRRIRDADSKDVIERVFLIHVEGFDWNCPQHITPRYTAEEIRTVLEPIEEQSRRLEAENACLREELAQLRAGR